MFASSAVNIKKFQYENNQKPTISIRKQSKAAEQKISIIN
jgi:hypothetical protein